MRYLLVLFMTVAVCSCKTSLESCYSTRFEDVGNTYTLNFDRSNSWFTYESSGPMIGQKISGEFITKKRTIELYPSLGRIERIRDNELGEGVSIEVYGEDFLGAPLPMVHLISNEIGLDTFLQNGMITLPNLANVTFEMTGYSNFEVDIPSPGSWRVYMYPEIGNESILQWRLTSDGIKNRSNLLLRPCNN